MAKTNKEVEVKTDVVTEIGDGDGELEAGEVQVFEDGLIVEALGDQEPAPEEARERTSRVTRGRADSAKAKAKEAESTPEEAPALAHPERVTVRFKGTGIGLLAGKQVLPGEIHEVSWSQYQAIRNTRKYERIDI